MTETTTWSRESVPGRRICNTCGLMVRMTRSIWRAASKLLSGADAEALLEPVAAIIAGMTCDYVLPESARS